MTISHRTSKQVNIINSVKMSNIHNYPDERCSKLQLKLNGFFIFARNPCATTMGACARSIFQTELARPCAKMNSWDLVQFCLRDAGTKLISDLGFLASQILGSSGGFSASRLLGLSGGFSTSRLQSTKFLFCQRVVPECLLWAYGLEPEYNEYSGIAPVQWFCLLSGSERA